MRSPTLPSPPRLVAPGGPVTRAVEAGRGETALPGSGERARLAELRRAIVAQLAADDASLPRLARIRHASAGGAA